jgi:iron complex transport system ATP-binding protein
MTDAIQINRIACCYRKTRVIDDLSFAVRQGEFLIIIGPNGSGKTTLIKSMAGLLPIASGRITLHGRPLLRYKRRELARRIAYVAQDTGVDSPFTVRETVLMGRAPYLGMLGVEGREDLALTERAMRFTGIDHLADRRLDSLSGGERQRAQIARAISQQPDTMILDEPTAALDLAHQIRIMELVADLKHRSATTVVMVSHDINLAAMFADRLLLLVDGKKHACGPPAQVIDEDLLEAAYGCALRVDASPCGTWRQVSLVRQPRK